MHDWEDCGYGVVETDDKGFAIIGYSWVEGARSDVWLIKTDQSGIEQWNRTYANPYSQDSWSNSCGFSIIKTSDGGYLLATMCNVPGQEGWDTWLIKTDPFGEPQWNQTYGTKETSGGSCIHIGHCVAQTIDGGYIIGGSRSNYTSGVGWQHNLLLIKISSSGGVRWERVFGYDNGSDTGISIIQTYDGGYAIAGTTNSIGAGSNDFWLVKTNENGIVREIPSLDTTSPAISILSPENKKYPVSDVSLTFTVNEATSWIGYSLDGQMNVTISGDTAIFGLSGGPHVITVYANDTAGNMGHSGTVYFTVDVVSPNIEILSPENKTYTTSPISLSFTVDEATSWIGYSLDGQANVTITGNTLISDLSDGSHGLIVYAEDTAGNMRASETIFFSIETSQQEPQETEPFPTWIVAAIVIIALVGTALLVYFTKDKKTIEEVK